MEYENPRRQVAIEQFEDGDIVVTITDRSSATQHDSAARVRYYTFRSYRGALSWLNVVFEEGFYEEQELEVLESEGYDELLERLDRIEQHLKHKRNPSNYWWTIGNDGQETLFT